MTDLAVVIVSWNVRDLLAVCLRSLWADLERSTLAAQVWVVDNGSADGTPEMVAREFPAVRLLVSDENVGFAAGNNRALRLLLADEGLRYVWLLNPDTQVRPGATAALVAALEAQPRAAVAGAALFNADGSLQHGAFRFPGLTQLAFDLFPLPARLYESPLNGRYLVRRYTGSQPFWVDHPLGAAMMVRVEAVRQVGLLDEGYRMYCEEVDWCLRAKRRGWQIYQIPSAQIVHHVGQSAAQFREAMLVELHRSRYLLFRKHYPTGFTRAHRVITRAGLAREMARALLLRFLGKIDRKELEQRLRAYRTIWSM